MDSNNNNNDEFKEIGLIIFDENTEKFNAREAPITNVGDPSDPTDAVNLNFLDKKIQNDTKPLKEDLENIKKIVEIVKGKTSLFTSENTEYTNLIKSVDRINDLNVKTENNKVTINKCINEIKDVKKINDDQNDLYEKTENDVIEITKRLELIEKTKNIIVNENAQISSKLTLLNETINKFTTIKSTGESNDVDNKISLLKALIDDNANKLLKIGDTQKSEKILLEEKISNETKNFNKIFDDQKNLIKNSENDLKKIIEEVKKNIINNEQDIKNINLNFVTETDLLKKNNINIVEKIESHQKSLLKLAEDTDKLSKNLTVFENELKNNLDGSEIKFNDVKKNIEEISLEHVKSGKELEELKKNINKFLLDNENQKKDIEILKTKINNCENESDITKQNFNNLKENFKKLENTTLKFNTNTTSNTFMISNGFLIEFPILFKNSKWFISDSTQRPIATRSDITQPTIISLIENFNILLEDTQMKKTIYDIHSEIICYSGNNHKRIKIPTKSENLSSPISFSIVKENSDNVELKNQIFTINSTKPSVLKSEKTNIKFREFIIGFTENDVTEKIKNLTENVDLGGASNIKLFLRLFVYYQIKPKNE